MSYYGDKVVGAGTIEAPRQEIVREMADLVATTGRLLEEFSALANTLEPVRARAEGKNDVAQTGRPYALTQTPLGEGLQSETRRLNDLLDAIKTVHASVRL